MPIGKGMQYWLQEHSRTNRPRWRPWLARSMPGREALAGHGHDDVSAIRIGIDSECGEVRAGLPTGTRRIVARKPSDLQLFDHGIEPCDTVQTLFQSSFAIAEAQVSSRDGIRKPTNVAFIAFQILIYHALVVGGMLQLGLNEPFLELFRRRLSFEGHLGAPTGAARLLRKSAAKNSPGHHGERCLSKAGSSTRGSGR